MDINNSCLKYIKKFIYIMLKKNPDKDSIVLSGFPLLEGFIKNYGISKFVKEYYRAYFYNTNRQGFEAELGITAILKNEAQYIKEWIEFHKLVGVQKFFLYDNESTDNLKEVLKPYIEKNEVIYKYITGEKSQFVAYQDSIRKNANRVKYMAFIDIDEFITPLKHNTITEFLEYLEKQTGGDFAALGINWVMHGFNGHYKRETGLVCEKFSKCDFETEGNKHIKSIVNPRTVILANHPHYFIHKHGSKIINTSGKTIFGPFSEPVFDDIIINHFWTKSYEEYLERCKKGKADGNTPIKIDYAPEFLSKDENTTMERFIPLLKEKLSV